MLQRIAVLAFLCLITITITVEAREFNRSGIIVLEEAWISPDLQFQVQTNPPSGAPPPDVTPAEFVAQFTDVHNIRLGKMDALNISYMVLSLASPGAQGFSDPVRAQNIAVTANNELAATIANNTERFGAFAAVSMHNATEAAAELERAVTQLGFLGALVNDYQQKGADNATLLYYDTPQYDPFWQMAQDLDVPIYLHPRGPVNNITALEWSTHRQLSGATWQFASSTSAHALGLCINGVFDRFPNLTVIIGHAGERIPSDLFRVDQQLARQPNPPAMKKTIRDYYQTNLISTTSGEFYTPLLNFHISEIGLERMMFSVDYPFQSLEEGVAWFNTLELAPDDIQNLGTQRAIEVLRLDR